MVILYHDRAKAKRIIEALNIYVVGNEVVKVRVIEASAPLRVWCQCKGIRGVDTGEQPP